MHGTRWASLILSSLVGGCGADEPPYVPGAGPPPAASVEECRTVQALAAVATLDRLLPSPPRPASGPVSGDTQAAAGAGSEDEALALPDDPAVRAAWEGLQGRSVAAGGASAAAAPDRARADAEARVHLRTLGAWYQRHCMSEPPPGE